MLCLLEHAIFSLVFLSENNHLLLMSSALDHHNNRIIPFIITSCYGGGEERWIELRSESQIWRVYLLLNGFAPSLMDGTESES